ncbi:4Fe-4S binding protein [Carboxylicivirga sp. A043]|uniref:4Fe-4S binding protein n=1 Tax=Carboxylicivirga litoralis TaxID=2816963 RepID=UPI0021CB89B1|nr:4Fe-4S binding protein [Carboxylicivirga sp. A043]MCU4154359.1 4Fe-4S binding protein [Carboxylicivirga sp. A043]
MTISKLKVPFISFTSFTFIGLIVWWFRDIRYFALFSGIGMTEFLVRTFLVKFPQYRQKVRLIVQAVVGGFLLFYLSLTIGVNFQFPQIIFDTTEGIVTGALIQTVVARLFLPFVLGNAFCSRACWTGLFFELTNTKSSKKVYQRNNYLAWGYLIAISVAAVIVVNKLVNPATDEAVRKAFIIGENLYIITIGFVLTFFVGSRAYCRLLCPFLTISGLFSPWSYFKVRTTQHDECTSCMKCNKICPMYVDIHSYVKENKAINHRQCILCERCVSACSNNVIKVDSNRNKKIVG